MSAKIPIKHLFDVSRNMIMPSDYEGQNLFHYSLPSWHECGDGIVEEASELASGKLLLTGGEVLISKLNPEKCAVLVAKAHEIPTVCSPEFIALTPRKIDRTFAYYFMLSAPVRHQLNASVESVTNSHKRARVDRFLASYVELPDLSTQRQIADFLDRETARIDLLIEKKQRLVALLGEKKNAQLSRLEQGIFDGKYPISRLSYHVAKVGSGKTPSGGANVYQDSGVIFLRSQNIKNDGIYLEDVAYISEEIDGEMRNSRVMPRDVLLNITGASIGRCAIAPIDLPLANVNQHVCIIRPMKHLAPEYLHILMLTPRMQGVIRSEAFSAGREGLNFESIRNFQIPVPDNKQVQLELAEKIASISLRDQNILAVNGRSIDRLQEYRSALITAAVTGQINVAEWSRTGSNERRLDVIQAEVEH